jgi:hypothetical protein
MNDCLLLLHNCNVLHLDIRSPNLLHFTSGWQVVDFDRAVLDKQTTFLQAESGQVLSAGYSLKKRFNEEYSKRDDCDCYEEDGCEVDVSVRDDIEMLFAAMSGAP